VSKGLARITAATDIDGGRPRALVPALAITQTVGYGVLQYAFPVLLTPIAEDLHASTAAVTGAMTTSIVVSAAAAIPVGRWLDRHGGRALMTAGSAVGVAAVLAWSRVHTLGQLYAVFVLIGLAWAASLYDAAFPVVIAASKAGQRDRSILAVTIVAGFASSIFLPLTAILLSHIGWRTTLLVLAVLLAVVTIPAHAAVVPGGTPAVRHGNHPALPGAAVRQAVRDPRFWQIAAAFVGQTAATSSVGVLLVTYLRQAGHPATMAAFLSGLLGVLSVTGRVATTGFARRHGMATVTAAVFAVQAVGAIALTMLSRSTAGAAACVIAFGLGYGVSTIARPAIVADRYGTANYATIASAMTLPITLSRAVAPLAAAAVAPNAFLITAGLICLISSILLAGTRRNRSSPDHAPATWTRSPSS
jgi:predicted MFS family arabinose efflux permease